MSIHLRMPVNNKGEQRLSHYYIGLGSPYSVYTTNITCIYSPNNVASANIIDFCSPHDVASANITDFC